MMSEKILNTVRGEGVNVIERASRVTRKKCRARREANRVSCVIKTPPYDPADHEPRYKNRTILWP